MKKTKILLMCLAVVIITGCTKNKEAITGDDFKEVIAKTEYKIQDYTSQFAYAKHSYLINQNNFYFLFVQGNKKYDIEGIFIDECENIYKAAGTDYDSRTLGGKNWTRLEVSNENTYYLVQWVGDTYIYAKASLENKEKVMNLIKEMNY